MAVQTIFTVGQGEQYSVEIVLKNGDTVITPYNSADVKIKLGKYTKRYSTGELEWKNNAWQFYITQDMSLALAQGKVDLQGQYMTSTGDIYNTEIYKVQVDNSIIKETW